jgi:hypothetical protein
MEHFFVSLMENLIKLGLVSPHGSQFGVQLDILGRNIACLYW